MLSCKVDLLTVVCATLVALRSIEVIGMVGNKTLSRKQKIDDPGERARQSPGQNSWVHKRDGF